MVPAALTHPLFIALRVLILVRLAALPKVNVFTAYISSRSNVRTTFSDSFKEASLHSSMKPRLV